MPSGVRLRVVVRGLSPLIVRTLDVPVAASLPVLHRVLLACFGWSGEHLHVFDIRGRSFSDSGYVNAESSRGVTFETLGLRAGERFCWRYDLSSDWIIDIRVGALVDVDAVRVVSGRRAGPPEWVGGPERFIEWEDSHSTSEVLDIVADAIDAGPVTGPEIMEDRLWPTLGWLRRDVFDRGRLQRALLELCGRWEQLEAPTCESSSRSASITTPTMTLVS